MAKIYNTRTIAKNTVSVGDDFKVFRYKGFSSKENKRNFKLYDFDLVRQNLINHFHIRKGEKLENPEFGTIIWDAIFEPFTTEIREQIAKDVEKIINYDKRIRVESITIDSTSFGIQLSATLIYVPTNQQETLRLDFDKKNNIVT
jgi:phage baseplate assembly protein W